MKRLLPVTIMLFPLLLTGCEKESDSSPADGRDFDAQTYIAGTLYTGRVIDGYLQNARVWLDLDGDGQHTPGPLTLENESGVELELPGGEPTAMTGEDGKFSLDVSELEQDPLVSPDLDPRDYPLIALALPGQTVEQTDAGNQLLDQAFMLSAPPGVRNVTPLTTLVRQRRINGIGEFFVGTSALALALGNINMVSDYVRSGDERAQAYAGAFARFLASQLPQDYEDILRDGDGLGRFLSAEAVGLMGISFARNALTIIGIVDEAAAGGDYAAVDVASLNLPEIELELDDSVIVSGQTVFARGDLPGSFFSLDALAELGFNYAEDGRLTSVVANGCMTPSLTEIVRVINADGKIAATETQWVPTLSLNQQSGTFYDEAGTDERLTFDWESGTAAFETRTTCHGLEDASELGGPPEIEYHWTLTNGKVSALTATSAGKTEVLTPDYAFSSDFFIGYTRTVNGADEEIVDLVSEPQSCTADIVDSDADEADEAQVVSAFQPFTLTGTLEIPSGFTNLGLELDTRTRDEVEFNRPLRYAFQNEEFQKTEGVSSSVGFEWRFYYPTAASDAFVADQPNLISTAYLARYGGDKDCGQDFGSIPTAGYARVQYSYQRLSEYLAGQIQ